MPQSDRLSGARVVLLAGGDSAEREISLKSGQAVAAALRTIGLNVETIDPALIDLNRFPWQAGDIAFIALHGGAGENGDIQALLEAAAVPYTGSGPAASQLAFSKSAAKLRFQQCGVPTPPFVLIHRSDSCDRLHEQAARIGYPLAVKPDQQGSSLGVCIVQAADDLAAAAAECFRYGSFGLIERAITGTEWTLGVLDDEPLPVIKIETPHAFFDFEAKYEDDATGYQFEFAESTNVVNGIVRAGHDACRAVGTSGVARVDLRLDAHGNPFVLEVNTVPGFTDHSLVPKAAARTGISFPDLCRRMLESALARAPGAATVWVRRAPRAWPARQAG
jgi:D-alanine-D-alanine ligase